MQRTMSHIAWAATQLDRTKIAAKMDSERMSKKGKLKNTMTSLHDPKFVERSRPRARGHTHDFTD